LRNTRFTRRQALKAGLGLGALAGGPGCGAPPNRCAPAPALAPGALLAAVDTIVVVMMENRSFDHMLGGLALDPTYPAAARIDGLTGREANPDWAGGAVPVNALGGDFSINPKHDWDSARACWNGGRNDGFVRVNTGDDVSQVMAYHVRATLPVLFALADEHTVCDRWFSSVMGPTWPNRFYLHAATAEGRKDNVPMGLSAPPTIWEQMAVRCLPAKNYYAGALPWYSAAFPSKSFSGNDAMVPEPIDHFFADAAAGTLPCFALVDPDFEVNDGHPPHDLALAEAFLGSIYRALVASPQWPRAMLVVTFDEHGGFYDHVAPTTVPDADAAFSQLGFRVPALVAGPSVRRGAVVSTPFEHVSVLATLRARFGVASLNPRMAAASDLSTCLDPELAAAAAAPAAPGDGGVAVRAPLPPTTALSASRTLAAPLHATSQREVHALAEAGRVPRAHIDPRPPEERVRAWLRHAQELEAVRVIA